MSQRNAEIVIGRLATDEGLRRRFREDPGTTLEKLIGEGLALNSCERRALLALDPDRVDTFATALHPCIQRVELPGER